MAKSPAHSFGQELGKFLEDVVLYRILQPRLIKFTQAKNYYLDYQKTRPVRAGKKVTWKDKYENKHDLDFVIEAGGSDTIQGTPVAFIEAAWRRYTKHSKNKAQEIQGAILPIVEQHHLSAPFYGTVLAGEFTESALTQLKNNNFAVLHIPYKGVVSAFKKIGFDIAFNEKTPHESFTAAITKLKELRANPTGKEMSSLLKALERVSRAETEKFMAQLKAALERFITRILLVPLYGEEIEALTVDEAIVALSKTAPVSKGNLKKIEIIVDYNNKDSIRATFTDVTKATKFLEKLV